MPGLGLGLGIPFVAGFGASGITVTNIFINSNIIITFSEEVDPLTVTNFGNGSGSFELYNDTAAAWVTGSLTTSDNIQFTFDPSSDFTVGDGLTLHLTSAIETAVGANPYTGPFTFKYNVITRSSAVILWDSNYLPFDTGENADANTISEAGRRLSWAEHSVATPYSSAFSDTPFPANDKSYIEVLVTKNGEATSLGLGLTKDRSDPIGTSNDANGTVNSVIIGNNTLGNSWQYTSSQADIRNNGVEVTNVYGTAWAGAGKTAQTRLAFAVDTVNGKWYIGLVTGSTVVWENSADPVTGTGGVDIGAGTWYLAGAIYQTSSAVPPLDTGYFFDIIDGNSVAATNIPSGYTEAG
jgi:hypothetical protein